MTAILILEGKLDTMQVSKPFVAREHYFTFVNIVLLVAFCITYEQYFETPFISAKLA